MCMTNYKTVNFRIIILMLIAIQYPAVSFHHILSQTKPCFGSQEAPLEA